MNEKYIIYIYIYMSWFIYLLHAQLTWATKVC